MVNVQHAPEMTPAPPADIPVKVAYGNLADGRAVLAGAEADAPIVGLSRNGPVAVDLTTNPRIMLATAPAEPTTAANLVKLMASHCLRHGGAVTLLDPHNRHRWATGLRASQHCSTVEAMHTALVAIADEADRRSHQLAVDPTTPPALTRQLVVVDDYDAVYEALRQLHVRRRDRGFDPARTGQRTSPAIAGLNRIVALDACWRINVLVIADRPKDQAIATDALRCQFPARITRNWLWSDLIQPATAAVQLDRLHAVVDGRVVEIQVPPLSAYQARKWSAPLERPAEVKPGERVR